jgi:hypothetical protein
MIVNVKRVSIGDGEGARRGTWIFRSETEVFRYGERSEAIQGVVIRPWMASLRSP